MTDRERNLRRAIDALERVRSHAEALEFCLRGEHTTALTRQALTSAAAQAAEFAAVVDALRFAEGDR